MHSLKNILLVTFPVDLGNRTIESNLHSIFKEDMDFFRFAAKHAEDIDKGKVTVKQSIIYRFQSAIALRKKVREYARNNKVIVFNGLSPALFSYGVWKRKKTVIALDWTRTLYPSVLGTEVKKNLIFYIHKRILRSCPKILCGTDALLKNLQEIYRVKESSLYKVPIPFLVKDLDIKPRPTSNIPKVLFVGGDLKRKGADTLLQYWPLLSGKCTLTMMTNDKSAAIEGVNFLPGIKYGSADHKRTFEEHDILILPTRIDSYPQVIGEAAAAGLAVVTTRFALAANEVIIDSVTGVVADSTDSCIDKLEELLSNIQLIDQYKELGYNLMHDRFEKERIRGKYLSVLSGNN